MERRQQVVRSEVDRGQAGRGSGLPGPRQWVALGVLVLAILLWPLRLTGGTEVPTMGMGAGADRSYALERITVELVVDQTGRYTVEEALTFRFSGGTFSRGQRVLEVGLFDSVDGIEVTSPDTEILEVEARTRRGELVVDWSYPERSDPATFHLRYEVEGALWAAEDENVIDWDVVGDGWDVPVESVRAEIVWPSLGLTSDEIRLRPEDGARLEEVEAGWRASWDVGRVEAGTSYRVLVHFPQRLEGADPDRAREDARGAGDALGLLGLFLLGLLPGGLVAAKGWHARPDTRTLPRPGAPDAPMEVAHYLAHGPQYWSARIFPAVLIDLARRGEVTLRRTPVAATDDSERAGGRGRSDDSQATEPDEEEEHLTVRVHSDPGRMSAFESRFLDELKGYESFEDFQEEGSTFRRDARKATSRSLVQEGYVEDRTTRTAIFTALAAVALGGGILALILRPDGVGPGLFAMGMGGALGFLVVALLRHPRTSRGSGIRRDTRSFLNETRTAVEEERDRDPGAAARRLADHLHWMLLDPGITGAWMERLRKAVEEEGGQLDLPPWLEGAVGSTSEDEEQIASMLAVYYIVLISQSSTGTAASATAGGMSTGSFSAAGMGASGGMGGGGGGVS